MNDELRWYLLKKKQTELLILSAFRLLRHENIEPILIKGWAAARNFPDGIPRFSIDIDLAVGSSDFETAKKVLAPAEFGLGATDLHCELRHLDTLAWSSLLENSQLVDLDGEQVRILSAEDHLRVLCVHWLTNGGTSRERLSDIYYAVENRPPDFDWDKCLGVVSEHRQGWIIATIGLAHRYLDLDISDLPFRDRAENLPPWLTRFAEKEWKDGSGLQPLEASLGTLRGFLHQLRKRLPPNPIQATVNCEGSIDARFRAPYQIRDIIRRFSPSVRRVVPTFVELNRAKRSEAK